MARTAAGVGVVALALTVLCLSLSIASADEGETKVTINQVPEAVKKAILKVVGDGKLVDIGKITRDGKTFYEIEMWKNGKEYDVLFDSNGKVLDKHLEGADDDDDDEDDDEDGDEDGEDDDDDDDGEEEKEVTLKQVPEAVRKTILKEAGKNKIEEIEEVSKDGKVIYYEAEWEADGKDIEIKVAPNGKLLSKEVDEDDDDEDEDDDDDDDDEDDDGDEDDDDDDDDDDEDEGGKKAQ